jgi:two-component system, chemotaxis family, chemotaxis protein CheY
MGYNLLFVDDSSAALMMYTKIVEVSGVEIDRLLTAKSGRQALEMVAANRVDFILTDINMPEMDGLQLIENLKAQGNAHIPIAVITSESRGPHLERAMQLGAARILKKPFLPEDIRKLIREVLGVESHGSAQTSDSESDF